MPKPDPNLPPQAADVAESEGRRFARLITPFRIPQPRGALGVGAAVTALAIATIGLSTGTAYAAAQRPASAAAAVSASALPADRATVVGPGESIQAAVDAADPGDTILVFGTHRENVAIQTDGLTLRGVRAAILPPATPAPHACFDPTEVGEAVHGVCVVGDLDFGTGEISRYVERVTVTGFTIRDFVGSGLIAVGARDTTFEGNVARNNTDDGIGSSNSTGTRVISNRASGNRFGVRVFSALGGRIIANSLHDNCVGVIVLASPFGPAGEFRMADNAVRHNTRACPPDDDFDALSGVGVGLVGATGTTIVGNRITGNVPGGETVASGGVAAIASPDGTSLIDNRVTGNLILGNDPDLFWDQTGTGNVFRPNVCRTSDPSGLCR